MRTSGTRVRRLSLGHRMPFPPSSFLLLLSLAIAVRVAAQEVSFEKDVRPILKAHCTHCHGEEEKPKGGVDLRLI